MTTSTRPSCVVSASGSPFMEEGGISRSPENFYGARMSSPPHSSEDSYYDGYGSDHSQATPGRSNDRESRKNAEKQRRTILNSLIGQLSTLLPVVSGSSKKIDKTSVLRLAANFLRVDHVFGDTLSPCHADVKPDAADALLELMGGFLITTTVKGIIMVLSPNVLNYLGYSHVDLLGCNILKFTHPDDVETVKQNLTVHDYVLPEVYPAAPQGSSYFTGYTAPSVCPSERRDFLVRLLKSGSRSEPLQYSLCRVDGTFRRADRAGLAGEGRLIRRQRVRRDHAIIPSGNDVVFVGVVRVLGKPFISDRLLEASKQEYWTRHLVDGRIVHCDQRISLVAGYMSEEVTGISAFTFMHIEDVRWVIIALRQMYDGNKLCGESCYRLASRTGQFMYLRTKGFLEIDRTTKAAQSFICINSLVSDEDGRKMISDMKEKYSAIIDLDKLDLSLQRLVNRDGELALEDPRQLEQIILHLITDLPSPSPASLSGRYSQSGNASSSGSPPCAGETLTIIPPTPLDVKSSIAKSIDVICGTLKRNKRPHKEQIDHNGYKRSCPDNVEHSSESGDDYG